MADWKIGIQKRSRAISGDSRNVGNTGRHLDRLRPDRRQCPERLRAMPLTTLETRRLRRVQLDWP